jgi:UrcA family protein
MKYTMRLCASIACASLSMLSFAPAMAQDDTIVQGERLTDYGVAYVAYRDLNLSKVEGEKTLRLRVHRAATKLCVPVGITDLTSRVNGWKCRDESIERAEPQIASVLERYQNQRVAALGQPVRIKIRASK